jgi:hypothetical protein
MPSRKPSIFKPAVLIQFQVTADNGRHSVCPRHEPRLLWTTQNDAKILTSFWFPGLWNAAHALRMATRAMVEVTISVEGSHGGCVRSPKICNRYHTSHTAQCRASNQSHAGAWSGGRHEGTRPSRRERHQHLIAEPMATIGRYFGHFCHKKHRGPQCRDRHSPSLFFPSSVLYLVYMCWRDVLQLPITLYPDMPRRLGCVHRCLLPNLASTMPPPSYTIPLICYL